MCIITATAALADSAETMEILKKWKYWDAPEETYSPCFTPFRSEAAAISKPPHVNTVFFYIFELLMYSCVVSKHITDRCICFWTKRKQYDWAKKVTCAVIALNLFAHNRRLILVIILSSSTWVLYLCMDYLYARQTVRNPYMIYLLFISSC